MLTFWENIVPPRVVCLLLQVWVELVGEKFKGERKAAHIWRDNMYVQRYVGISCLFAEFSKFKIRKYFSI